MFSKIENNYTLSELGRKIANPAVLFFALPWLMILLIIGTITQRYIGLYESVQTYFSSFIFWWGVLPLPGGLLTIAIITTALSFKFLFYSKWNFKHSGIILSHLGVLILLYGGLITSVTNKEGFMIIPEGDVVSNFSSYRNRVLNVEPSQDKKIAIPFETLKVGKEIKLDDITIKIDELCDNCSAQAPTGGDDKVLQGLAENMELVSVPSEIEAERNLSGITLSLTQSSNESEIGTYILLEDIPKNPEFKTEKQTIKLSLGREKSPLGFSVKLIDFQKTDYPGTNKAKEYQSDLIIYDKNAEWPVKISMNKPFRYKGYSFYQSSFVENPELEATVLSVVKNSGRAFPYISSLIIFLGLLIHLIIRLISKNREVS